MNEGRKYMLLLLGVFFLGSLTEHFQMTFDGLGTAMLAASHGVFLGIVAGIFWLLDNVRVSRRARR